MLYRAQVVLNHASGLPKDHVNNVFHVVSPNAASAADAEEIAEAIRDFYTVDAGAQALALSQYIGSAVTDTLHQVRMYDIVEATGESNRYEGAPPLHTEPFDLVGRVATVAAMPSEVACRLSMRNVTSVAYPAPQRRGGIYFGPLEFSTTAVAVNDVPRPIAQFTTDLRLAALRLSQELTAQGHALVVYSRPFAGRAADTERRANGTFLPALPARAGKAHVVEQFLTDDAFDTQRRRGEARLARAITAV